MTWYANQMDRPLAPSRGQLMDHVGLSVADLDAWVAKLRGEGVKFLAEPYTRSHARRADRRAKPRGAGVGRDQEANLSPLALLSSTADTSEARFFDRFFASDSPQLPSAGGRIPSFSATVGASRYRRPELRRNPWPRGHIGGLNVVKIYD
jgi:hypothetical protein